MQSQNRFFDDLSKMATGAMGTLAGMRREMEAAIRQRMEEFIGGLDLVKRDEFDAVKAMAAKAREENAALTARIAKLEAAAAPRAKAAPEPSTARKPTAKKPAKP
jgi:hypothetical protein